MRKYSIMLLSVLLLFQGSTASADETGNLPDSGDVTSVTADLSSPVSVTDLADNLGMDLTGFSTSLLEGTSVPEDMSLDIDSLAKLEKEGADQYLTGVFGSSYAGLDSNLFGATVPDMDFEDLNTSFADMKASMDKSSNTISTDLAVPQLSEGRGSNAKEVFQNSWGDMSAQLANKEFQIPSGFDAGKMLQQGAAQREKTFGELYASSGYKTASGKLNVSNIFADAADGVNAYTLDSNSTLFGRLDKSSVSDLISGKKSSLKSDFLSGKSGARKKYSTSQDNASSTYEGLVDALKKDYENGASRHTKSGELCDDLGIGG